VCPHPDLKQLHIVLLRKVPLPKMWVITKYNWERALLDYCKGEADLKNEAQELENNSYLNLSLVARYGIIFFSVPVPVYSSTRYIRVPGILNSDSHWLHII
jgi:hypothetical protein